MNIKYISAITATLLMLLVSDALAASNENSQSGIVPSHRSLRWYTGFQLSFVSKEKITDSSGNVYEEANYLIRSRTDPVGFPSLGVHLIKKAGTEPEELMVMLPGTGLKFKTNFLLPEDHNLALYLAGRGFEVVGIDYRYTVLPYDPAANYSYLNDMGIAQHAMDTGLAVTFAQHITNIRNYRVLGHSLGGIVAVDYAARYSHDKHLKGIIVLDVIGRFNPVTEPQMVQMSRDGYNATVQQVQSGQYANLEVLGFGQLAAAAQSNPDGDSGVPNPFVPGTNLTNVQLILSALIYSSQLPGNFYYVQGFCAGDMINGLYHSPIELLYNAASNGTIYPMVVDKDFNGLFANVPGSYQIQYSKIKAPVLWLNTELGFGDRPYTALLIRQGGNHNVVFKVVPGYGHADLVYSSTAKQDVWVPYLNITAEKER